MNKLSALFHENLDGRMMCRRSNVCRNALLHNLTAQTSFFRYWGQGRWTDYAKEICRRGAAARAKQPSSPPTQTPLLEP